MAWALPTAENNEVTMLHQALWQSSVLTGASFCGDDIAVVQYDHEEAAIYPAE